MRGPAIVPRLVGSVLACAACVGACWLLGDAAVHTARGQRLDQLVLTAAQHDTSPMRRLVFPVLNTVTLPVIVVALVIAAIAALLQRRTSMALHMVVLVAGAAATTQVVKHVVIDRSVLARGVDATTNSFPSGHTTLAGGVAVALTLASPRSVRSLVAVLGAAWTAIAGIGTIASGWHRPSDVVGALLVVGAWTFLVLGVDAAIALARRPRDAAADPTGERAGRVGAILLVVLAVVALTGGAALGAQIPTPLRLDSSHDQALAYASTVAVVSGAASALVSGTLWLHIPTRPGRPRAGRVR